MEPLQGKRNILEATLCKKEEKSAVSYTHVASMWSCSTVYNNYSHCKLPFKECTFSVFFCLALRRYAFDYMILEFAQEPGYLSLTPSSRAKLNITIIKSYIGRYIAKTSNNFSSKILWFRFLMAGGY